MSLDDIERDEAVVQILESVYGGDYLNSQGELLYDALIAAGYEIKLGGIDSDST